MREKLFWAGILLSGMAAVMSVVSVNMNANGVPSDVHPVGAIAVGVAAIAFLYGSTVAPPSS